MLQLGICLVCAALIAIDQLTKWLAIVYFKGADPLMVIEGIVSFTYTENTGAAWSLFSGQRWLLVGGTALMLSALFVVLLSGMFKKNKAAIVGGMLVFSGGFGNLIDRFFRGFVVDFIKAEFIDFPIFNFADCLIVVGAIWLFVYFVFVYSDPADRAKKSKKKKEPTVEHVESQTDRTDGGNEA
ncbi:MAG: signal peptidase II [Clostridia bacterium]|nr:signal peptidase II [Clostridia bacterium]